MSNAAVINYEEHQVIFTQGGIDRYFYKIMSGRVGLYLDYGTSDERLVGISDAPHYIGAFNALSLQPSEYTAVALTKAMLLKLPEDELTTFAKSDPVSAVELMRTMVHQITEQREELRLMHGELKDAASSAKPDRKELQAMADRYGELVGRELILDAYEPYVPEPEPEVVPEPVVVVSDAAKGEDLYLSGHRGYPGVHHPEYKNYLISVDYTCPHCHTSFKGSKILTSRLIPVRNEAEERRFDLRVSYRGFEAEWYEIITCPHCYFSAFENYFSEKKSLYKSRYETKLVRLCDGISMDFSGERDLDFVFTQHYLALICAQGFTDWRQINARVWGNLVRLYQDAGEDELADIAERRALDAYQTVYMECELQPGQEQRLCLTVAGILYARGEKKEARVWASKVRSGSGDRSGYWNMAETLIQDVRAEMDSEGQ